MENKKVLYFLCIIGAILTGLLSRKDSFVPFAFGDAMYAVMMYFIVRFSVPETKSGTSFLVSLLLCFGVEISQLCQADWIVSLRNVPGMHYILGQGFLWSDLVAYTIGAALVYVIDTILRKKNSH